MKLKLFIIALLVSVTVYSQRNISVSTEIEKYVASFVEEGHKRGLPILDSLFNKVDYIIVDYSIQYPNLGYFYKENKTAFIAGYTTVNSLIVRTTVFHELGHAMLDSKEHTCERCSDIMSASAPETFSIFAKEEEWQKALDKLFNQIKEKFKK